MQSSILHWVIREPPNARNARWTALSGGNAGTFLTYACWITSLSQQSPATHSVSGKTDSWIIREAGIPGSDDTCPARGLHTTLGFSMNIGYGKIVAKANRNFTHSLIEDNENSQFFEKLSDYSGPPRATCPDFESHHSGEWEPLIPEFWSHLAATESYIPLYCTCTPSAWLQIKEGQIYDQVSWDPSAKKPGIIQHSGISGWYGSILEGIIVPCCDYWNYNENDLR